MRDPDAPVERESFKQSVSKWAKLRDVLPADGVVGLLTEQPLPATDHFEPLYMAQYALAPRVVVASMKPDWLVVESSNGILTEELEAAGRWYLVHRAEGISVYRRKQ